MSPTDLFEKHRRHLGSVAYRMLGSFDDAEDALQEAWLKTARASMDEVENPVGWLTTIVARTCLNILRARRSHPELPMTFAMPDPVVAPADSQAGPEAEAVLSDSVGLALLVVLDTLTPAERVSYVLHDMFNVPFDDIALLIDRTPSAARQLASRARRRVEQEAPEPDTDPVRQREAVDAFFAASRDGDFDALVAVLDPEVVLRSDGGTSRPDVSVVLRGAATVAGQALTYSRWSPFVHPVLVNGAAGVLVVPQGRTASVMGFTVRGGRIVAIDVLADPERLRRIAA